MQYSIAAIVALVATASATYPNYPTNQTVVYTTEVHTAYTTVCPAATELTFNGVTYTATEVSDSEHGTRSIFWGLRWDGRAIQSSEFWVSI
jgi:hypothetical protein